MGMGNQHGQDRGGAGANVVRELPSRTQNSDQIAVEQLSAQLAAGHSRLRFVEPLEAAFRADYEDQAHGPRSVLLVLAIGMIGITPLYDRSVLDAPAAYATITHWLQWALMVPVLVGVLVVQRRHPRDQRRLMQVLTILAAVTVAAGLTAQRAIAGYYNFHFPHDFGVIAIVAVFAMARLRFFLFLPWAVLLLAAMLAVEFVRIKAPGQPIGAAPYNASSMVMLWVLASTGAWLFEHLSRRAWLQHELTRRLAAQDVLTGLSNRRHFQMRVNELIREAERQRRPITLMLLDLDHFKPYNDHYGHLAGDECLRKVGEWMAGCSRLPHDVRARIGGEEFVAVWIGLEPGEAARHAEALRDGIGKLCIAHAQSPSAQVLTSSAGMVHGVPGRAVTVDLLLRNADALLYAAKADGRNRLHASFGALDEAVPSVKVVPLVSTGG